MGDAVYPLLPRITLILNRNELWGCGRLYKARVLPQGGVGNRVTISYDGGNGSNLQLVQKELVEIPINTGREPPMRLVYSKWRYYIITPGGQVYETGHTLFNENNQRDVELNNVVVGNLVTIPENDREMRDFSCGARNGAIACDDLGQVWVTGINLDHYSFETRQGFVMIPNVINIQSVSHGFDHALMLDYNGVPYSIGIAGSEFAALGRAEKTEGAAPMEGLPEGVIIVSLKAGVDCSYLLDREGEIWACGKLATLADMDEYVVDRLEQMTLIKWPPEDSPMRDPLTKALEVEEIYECFGTFCARKTNGDWWIGGFDIFDVSAPDGMHRTEIYSTRHSVLPHHKPQFGGCKLIFQGPYHMWFARPGGEVLSWGSNYDYGLGVAGAENTLQIDPAQVVPGFTYYPPARIPTKGAHNRPSRDNQSPPPPGKRSRITCAISGCGERANYVCGQCKRVPYCSKWCRHHHWRILRHVDECVPA